MKNWPYKPCSNGHVWFYWRETSANDEPPKGLPCECGAKGWESPKPSSDKAGESNG